MKYKVTKTDLLINGKLIPENSEVELSTEETKGIENYLIPIKSEGLPAITSATAGEGSNSEQKNKTKRGKK
jgi:hypothetical protein